MATTMTEIPIKDLALTTAPAGKQLLVRDASAGLQRIDYDQIAKNLVESYGSSSLAGKNQSIKAAIDSLNSGLTQNTSSISTINDSLLKLSKCNYGFHKYPILTFSESYTQNDYNITISNTNGHPIFLNICGDINPLNDHSQLNIIIYKNGNMITQQIAESKSSSQNIPFSLNYLDIVPKGTYEYTFSLSRGTGKFVLGENGVPQSSQCMAFEI